MKQQGIARWLPALALVAAALAPLLARTNYGTQMLNLAAIHAILAVGYYVIFGLTGILSIAHAAFWGIGAYTSAILTVDVHLPIWVGFLAAPLVAALFGVLLGLPTLKLKTHYLTMATIGFAQVVRQFLINWDTVTHGPSGIRAIPVPDLGLIKLDTPFRYYYLSLTLLAVVVVAVLWLRRSRLGRGLEAVRDDELAAESSGVNVTLLKVMAFALSAAIAGVAGALYAHQVQYISPDVFHLEFDIVVLAMLMIGGRNSVAGAVAGAVLVTYLPEVLRSFKDWYLTIYGAMLMVILIFMPEGVAGLMRRYWDKARRTKGGVAA